MHAITLGDSQQPVHKLKLCNRCNETKPPEGGVDMGQKWLCQGCWLFKTTGRNLKQNRTTRG